MSHLSIHILPKDLSDDSPLWEKFAWRIRPIRLDSLKLDPDSFISKYESEATQPIDFTIGRLREPNAWTVVLVRTTGEAATRDPDFLLKEDTEYVGFCVMVDTRTIPASIVNREGDKNYLKRLEADWFMAAVYVDRSVRGTGFGKKMVQYGIDTIREASPKTGSDTVICVTNVVHGNDKALELYKKLGFKVTDPDAVEEKEGRSYHTTQLKMQL